MLITANFGAAATGLATVGYKLLNADKTQYAARTTTGVTELGGGVYGVQVADATLASRTAVWDTGETIPKYASETFAPSAAVAGATEWTYTLTTPEAVPIADADVWATTDVSGANVVASGTTDNFGVVTFWLDAGTYYIWRQKSGWTFVNPDIEVVS